MTSRTGGRYVRDPKTKALTQVEGPALRPDEPPAAKPAKTAKTAPPEQE